MRVPILLPNIFNHPFTYETNIKLKLGDYVEVPFGKSKATGVVWDEFEKNIKKNFTTKQVIKKFNIPSLNKNIINFLNWFSEYNMIPKGMALKLLLLSSKVIEELPKKNYENFNDKIINQEFKLNFLNLYFKEYFSYSISLKFSIASPLNKCIFNDIPIGIKLYSENQFKKFIVSNFKGEIFIFFFIFLILKNFFLSSSN